MAYRFLFLITLIASCALAQDNSSKHFVLPMNQNWKDQPWRDSVYRFSDFQDCRFEFTTGYSVVVPIKINYNLFLESIDMKNAEGKILSMARFEEIRFIYIGDHKFYYDPKLGYLEIVVDGEASVARRSFMAGISRLQTAIDTRTDASDVPRDYWPAETYYILGPDYKVRRFGPNALPSIFPHMKYHIKLFARENKINYRSNDDLFRMVKFCNDNYASPDNYPAFPDFFRLPPGVKLEESDWKDSIYRFTNFKEAAVRFEGGSVKDLPLNLDFTSGKFITLNANGEPTSINQPISTVTVDDVTFFNHKAFGQLELVYHGGVSLAVKKEIIKREVASRTTAEAFGLLYEDFFEISTTYFFVKNNRAFNANSRTLKTLFPKHKEDIDGYVIRNKPSFSSKKDLIELLSWCYKL